MNSFDGLSERVGLSVTEIGRKKEGYTSTASVCGKFPQIARGNTAALIKMGNNTTVDLLGTTIKKVLPSFF